MTKEKLEIKMYSFTIDCKDLQKLSKFYVDLLDWALVFSNQEWACIAPKGIEQGGYPGILFQYNSTYLPPVWPQEPLKQQQMAHIDFAVNHLEEAISHAEQCGAKEAPTQFSDNWRVMFDPEGHPFCLCQMKEIIDSPSFALL